MTVPWAGIKLWTSHVLAQLTRHVGGRHHVTYQPMWAPTSLHQACPTRCTDASLNDLDIDLELGIPRIWTVRCYFDHRREHLLDPFSLRVWPRVLFPRLVASSRLGSAFFPLRAQASQPVLPSLYRSLISWPSHEAFKNHKHQQKHKTKHKIVSKRRHSCSFHWTNRYDHFGEKDMYGSLPNACLPPFGSSASLDSHTTSHDIQYQNCNRHTMQHERKALLQHHRPPARKFVILRRKDRPEFCPSCFLATQLVVYVFVPSACVATPAKVHGSCPV